MNTSSDPRGPERKVVKVEDLTNVTLVTLDCGHEREANQIHTYRIGETYRCLRCKKEEAHHGEQVQDRG